VLAFRGAAKHLGQMAMKLQEKLSAQVQQVLNQGLLRRLPLSFLPFVNQHLRNWELLFPFERRYMSRLLIYLGNLQDGQFAALFHNIRELETRMGVSRWGGFSTQEETIEDSSLLARSPYYQEWRREVQRVFDQIEKEAPPLSEQAEGEKKGRLVLLILPARVPLDPTTLWARWQGMGKPFALDLARPGQGPGFMEALFRGAGQKPGSTSSPLLDVFTGARGEPVGDIWVIEAGTKVGDLLQSNLAGGEAIQATVLSFQRLKLLRESFLENLNSIRRDLADADSAYTRLRKMDISAWCPPEISAQPAAREFLRELFLNGNGGLVFPNSFVEWGPSSRYAGPGHQCWWLTSALATSRSHSQAWRSSKTRRKRAPNRRKRIWPAARWMHRCWPTTCGWQPRGIRSITAERPASALLRSCLRRLSQRLLNSRSGRKRNP